MYTQKTDLVKHGEEENAGEQGSGESNEDMGRHLLLKEIREMAVPSQPAVRLSSR